MRQVRHKKHVMLMDKSDERLKLRQKVVSRGRSELTRKIKNGTFIELNKTTHGIMDENDIMLDKEFLNDIIKEIEKNRAKSLVYEDDYKRQELEEWIEIRDEKVRRKRLSEKIRKSNKHLLE